MNPRPTIDLSDLVKDPTRVADVDPSQIPVLLTLLGTMQASMAARLVADAAVTANEPQDELLTIEEAAKRLNVATDWLYRRTKTLPFVVRVGRNVRFSAKGIDRFIRNRLGR